MIERKKLVYKDDSVLRITFDGFFNYEEFAEVMRMLKEDIKVEYSDFSTGWESSNGCTKKDGIELNWKFNNWDCIQLIYGNPKNELMVNKVQEWSDYIFKNLITRFGEVSE